MNIERVSKNIDLIYSPDDGGFYFEKFEDGIENEVSTEVWPTKEEAMNALHCGDVEWM